MEDKNKEDKKDFVDPAFAGWLGVLILTEVFKAVVAFFTMKSLRLWWTKKFGKDECKDPEDCYHGTSDEE